LTENILIEQGRDTEIVSYRLNGVFPELGFQISEILLQLGWRSF